MDELKKTHMCRVIVTGASGFVGQHLCRSLEQQGRKVLRVDRTHGYNVLDSETIYRLLKETQPEAIYHLAGFSSVSQSWDNPAACFMLNVEGTENILNAAREAKLRCPILFVSSSEVYGQPTRIPTNESNPVQPLSPFGESRARQEKLIQQYTDLNWVIARSYSHIGPGQAFTFSFPMYARRLLEVKNGMQGNTIQFANIDEWRDISDVRDVVQMYQLLLEKGKPRTIVNVCSGYSYLVRNVIEQMADIVGVNVELHAITDPAAPPRIKYQSGDTTLLHSLIGNFERRDLVETLSDVIRYVRHERA